jgi:hypothetical protein
LAQADRALEAAVAVSCVIDLTFVPWPLL